MSQAFPSNYLRAADLDGHEVEVKISHVDMSEVGTPESPKEKPVLYFIGKKKGLVLNKTNTDVLVAAYGDESETWKNEPVILYPTTTTFKGQTVPCLRVRVPAEPASEEDSVF